MEDYDCFSDDTCEQFGQMILFLIILILQLQRSLVLVKQERNPDAHVENFVEVTVPRYSGRQFHEHFRMSSTTFEVSH